jgi:hypothetical protein
MGDKGLRMARCADPRQGYFDGQADQYERTKLLELVGAGADVLHGAEVESEVADIRAVGADIGLFADRDIIQARGLCIVRRKPRHTDAPHVLLKPFQEGHKIPNGKNVIFHEAPQIGDGTDLRIKRVIQ